VVREASRLGLTARIPVCEHREFMLTEAPSVEILWESRAADAVVLTVGARPPMLRCERPAERGESAAGA
jgi:hypothetical protein